MAKIKPGTKHPSKPGLVMGKNGRYVSKSTYVKQQKATASTQIRPKGKTKTTSKATPKGRPQLPSAGQTSAKTTPRGRASAKRAMARAKQVRAAQGTRTPGVRTGSTSNIVKAGRGTRMGNAARRFASQTGYASDLKAAGQGAAKVGRGVGRGARLVGRAGRAAGPALPGVALGAAIAGSAGKPNAAKMSRLGVGGDAPTYSNPIRKAIQQLSSTLKTRSGTGTRNRRGRVVSKGKPNTAPTTTQKKVTPPIKKSLQKPAEKKPANTKPASTTKPTVVTKPPTAKPTAKPTSKPTQAKTQTKAKSSPKPTGSTLSRELAGAKTFIKKFKGKKGMERAVTKMEARQKRLEEDLKIFESVV